MDLVVLVCLQCVGVWRRVLMLLVDSGIFGAS